MDYDFNDVRQMLDEGKSIDDICQAFADKVNEANADYQRSQKSQNSYTDALTKAADAWNESVDRYADVHHIDWGSPADLYINCETVNKLVTLLYEMIGWKDSLAPLIETLVNVTNNKSSEEKIVAKKSGPTQVSNFSQVIADFLNDID